METIATLPGGQVLGKEEQILSQQEFVSALSTFYIKSSFAVTNKRFVSHYPNVLLGFIPAGMSNTTFNIKQISGVQIVTQYKALRILIGLGLIVFGLSEAVLLALVGMLVIFSGVEAAMRVASSSGVSMMPVVFWEKAKAEVFVQNLNTMIAENS